MRSSGRIRLAVERAPLSRGTPRICRSRSRRGGRQGGGSSPTRVICNREPPRLSAAKCTRAPGRRSSAGRIAASNSCWLRLRVAARRQPDAQGGRLRVACFADVAQRCPFDAAAARAADRGEDRDDLGARFPGCGLPARVTASVSASVEPGGEFDRQGGTAAVAGGDEVVRDERHQGDDPAKNRTPAPMVVTRWRRQQRSTPIYQRSMRPAWRSAAGDRPRAGLQQIGAEQRRQQTGNEQREADRGGDRQAELAEKLAGDAGHEGDRHEDGEDRRGGGDDGEADLGGAIEGGAPGACLRAWRAGGGRCSRFRRWRRPPGRRSPASGRAGSRC